ALSTAQAQAGAAGPITAPSKAVVVDMDRDWSLIGMEAALDLHSVDVGTGAAALAYDGSDPGGLDGMTLSYALLTSQSEALAAALELSDQDRLLSVSSLSSGLTIPAIFAALSSGTALITMELEQENSGGALQSILQSLRPTALMVAGDLWGQLTRSMRVTHDTQFLDSVRLIAVMGGRPLKKDWNAWRACFAESQFSVGSMRPRLLRLYLASDCPLVLASLDLDEPLQPFLELSRPILPAGRAMPGVNLYILDPGLEPVPPGVVGQLYLSAELIAGGSRMGQALTAERFIPNLLTAELGVRMQSTGDLARYLPDGTIEFAGSPARLLLNGFVIKPGEIEAALLEHELVHEARVIEEGEGHQDLAAFVVTELSDSALVDYARDRLPSYMIPRYFVKLKDLPLTPSGIVSQKDLKLSRKERLESTGTEMHIGASSRDSRRLGEEKVLARRAALAERRAKLSEPQQRLLKERLLARPGKV
ncbi:MAG TPA: AMP-binding protein, partial [Blastocatellia bacterium]|nr:AMP-binding protein [Blastocatellia bacterium]